MLNNNYNNNSVTDNSLLILLFNANGLRNDAHKLETVLNNKRIDIALISETHFTNNSKTCIPGYKLMNTNHPDNTAHGGVAIYVYIISLKKTLAKHKNLMLVDNLTNLSSKDGSLWKATKKILRYKAPNLPLVKHNGSLTSSDSEKADIFKIHLSEVFLLHPDIFDPDTISLV